MWRDCRSREAIEDLVQVLEGRLHRLDHGLAVTLAPHVAARGDVADGGRDVRVVSGGNFSDPTNLFGSSHRR